MKRLPLVLLLALCLVAGVDLAHRGSGAYPARLPLSYTGLNYYDPTDYFTGCHEWTWLEPRCYWTGLRGRSDRAQLVSDLNFVRRQRLGSLLRVWVSLDQLMRIGTDGAFAGYQPPALQDVDDMLRQFASHRMRVVLVLLAYSPQSGWLNQFKPWALDGRHPGLRAGYLRAVRLFIRHLAANPGDVHTAPIIELQTEPYYQLEQYFADPTKLGAFASCGSSIDTGPVSNGCIDRRIVHPWLVDLYNTARAASKRFLYTEADTGRLLTTNAADQRYWISMYPADVYDIHAYAGTPWLEAGRWASGRNLPKPWFAGEAGCGSGNIGCTYNGRNAAPVDRWWLEHLRNDGASAVLLESHVTLWRYPNGPNSQMLTPTGRILACVSRSVRARCSLQGGSAG
ncbi:MAG TPA: hypothetical protein VFB34_06585 [Chloroflexota bacterium]|nr:hypothetical protein [Chloroflexota bacterium]